MIAVVIWLAALFPVSSNVLAILLTPSETLKKSHASMVQASHPEKNMAPCIGVNMVTNLSGLRGAPARAAMRSSFEGVLKSPLVKSRMVTMIEVIRRPFGGGGKRGRTVNESGGFMYKGAPTTAISHCS